MQKKLIFSIIILLNLNFIKAPDWAGVTKKIQINPPYGPWVYPPMKFRNKLAILTVIGASASQYYKYQQQKKHKQQTKYE